MKFGKAKCSKERYHKTTSAQIPKFLNFNDLARTDIYHLIMCRPGERLLHVAHDSIAPRSISYVFVSLKKLKSCITYRLELQQMTEYDPSKA